MGKHLKVRLPFEYNLKEQKKAAFEAASEAKARKMFKQYDAYTIDIVILASILALIEGEGWGTGKTATRIHRYIARVEKTIEDVCARYEHKFALTAMQMKVKEYGITYEGRYKDDEN